MRRKARGDVLVTSPSVASFTILCSAGVSVPAPLLAFAFATTALCRRSVRGPRHLSAQAAVKSSSPIASRSAAVAGPIAGVPNLVANLPVAAAVGRGRAEKAHCLWLAGLTGQTCRSSRHPAREVMPVIPTPHATAAWASSRLPSSSCAPPLAPVLSAPILMPSGARKQLRRRNVLPWSHQAANQGCSAPSASWCAASRCVDCEDPSHLLGPNGRYVALRPTPRGVIAPVTQIFGKSRAQLGEAESRNQRWSAALSPM